MSIKKNLNSTTKINYEEILEEEIINSYEKKFEADSENNKKNNRYYWLKRKKI